MSKYIITADLQLHDGSRFDDAMSALNNIYDMIDSTIDGIIILGDIYEYNNIKVSSVEELFFIDWLNRVMAINVPIYILVGNHDLINNTTHLFLSLKEFGFDKLNIIDSPTVVGDLMFIPYIHKSMLSSAGMSYREMMLSLFNSLRSPAIVFSHCDVVGAEPESGVLKIRDALTVKDIESHDNVKAFFSGHIHRHQNLGKSKPVVYCGSPIHTSFASSNNPKGIIILDTDKFTDWRFVELECRMQVEVDFEINKNAIDELYELCVENMFVKVRLIYVKGQYSPMVAHDIKKLLYDSGAHDVTIVPIQLGVSKKSNIEPKNFTSDEELICEYLSSELHINDIDKYMNVASKYIKEV